MAEETMKDFEKEIAQKVKKKMADSGVTDAILEGPETVWEEFE